MNLFKKIVKMIDDASRPLQERSYILLTTIAEIAVLIVFIADIILNEDIREIIVLGSILVASPILSFVCVRKHRTKFAGILIVIGVVFVIMPVTFFFGGGMFGGAIIWFSFAFLYIGMLLTGVIRTVMLILLSLLAGFEYYMAYFHSNVIVPHTNRMFYLDSLVSVILVGIVIYIMIWFQTRMFLNENKRAEEQKKEIEALNASQNQFFSSMSHEIRTPINTIIGLNEMILKENISDEVADDAANIQAASKMLLHLINDILDMSKFQSGQMKLTPTSYHPGDMLSEIVGMLWIRAKEKKLEFHVSVAPDIPYELMGDEVRIKQILINVVNNAIKYTKEGSVSLSIQCGEKNGNELNIIYTVTDTGIGIKKESMPYLFTAFKRVDEEKNRHIEGTGLGLSIVKQFVDLMGGKITVNSVYTKGSTFIIEIPQTIVSEKHIGNINLEKKHELGARNVSTSRFEAPEANVLIVDDNASNLLVVSKLLRDTKVKIDTAPSGAEALTKTLNKMYNVIFMDHLMPEMDGIECHRKIRAQVGGMCRESKIVALTANAGGENRALYEAEGFDGYLVKPVSGEELEKELYRLLPSDLVYVTGNDEEILEETISWMHKNQRKKPVVITTESVADIAKELLDKHGIEVIPHIVCTSEGEFKDGIEIETDGLLNYMRDPSHKVKTMAPDVQAHEAFFAKQLSIANNVIHISISSKLAQSGCPVAIEASRAFDNVTVIDSQHLSSGQGLMVLEACRLAEKGLPPAEITKKINEFRGNIHTSFIVDNLDFLARAEQINKRIADITKSFMARPVLVLKNGKMGVGRIFFGSQKRSWRKYIDSVLRLSTKIDKSILFVTHVGLTKRDMDWIEEYIESKVKFDHIYFQKASPAIAVNCGAGTFGLLWRERNDNS